MAANQSKAKKLPLRQQDPFLEREKLKYPNPLPSREFILSLLAEQGVPLFPGELAEMLSILPAELGFFERRLLAMEREGQVIINRKGAVCVAGKLDLIKCRIQGHRDGYGFAVPAEGDSDDLFLPEREMRKVMHGDIVMVRQVGTDKRGRTEGAVVEVLDRAVSQVVGRIYHERGVWMVVPEDKRISHDILMEAGGEGKATHGQVVMAEIVTPPDSYRQAIGRVVEVLGNYADPGMEIEIALRKHDLPYRFPDAAAEQAQQLAFGIGDFEANLLFLDANEFGVGVDIHAFIFENLHHGRLRLDSDDTRAQPAECGDTIADMGADIEYEIAAPYEAAVEPVHGCRARAMAIIDTQRPDDAARGPEAFEHGGCRVRPNAAPKPQPRWREAPN